MIESTAIGMDAETVSPTLSARYTLDAAKITPSTAPRTSARTVSSAGDRDAGTYGSKVGASLGAGGGAMVAIRLVRWERDPEARSARAVRPAPRVTTITALDLSGP